MFLTSVFFFNGFYSYELSRNIVIIQSILLPKAFASSGFSFCNCCTNFLVGSPLGYYCAGDNRISRFES
ncbi:hypothetical protein OIU74_015221 [Salix koriyanagi]|uniref:Uncharacterized protein n=1 Tax=Salix koriyanagi TaxID=2511006 RepID=A0A9Q0T0N6_9ROSI|nr:hypothetical protein OIU74_015221 [Salix koriyanagi]